MSSAARVLLSGKRPLAPAPRAALRRLIGELLVGHSAVGAVSIVFVDDDEIRAVHREFFGEDSATDVVTFPMDDGPAGRGDCEGESAVDDPPGGELLGEIMVSVETARRESVARGIPFEREVALYAVHGVLHLLGYDDVDAGDRRRMRRAEKRTIDRFDF